MSARNSELTAGTFSILERIDVGETGVHEDSMRLFPSELSVSSNGSTWVKPRGPAAAGASRRTFSILERIDVGETL